MMIDWEVAYRNEDTPWDKGQASPPLVAYLKRHPVRGEVLVPGCGVGHDVRLLAGQGAEVLGLDIAEAAVEKAECFETIANERYQVGDFLNVPEELKGRFDYVFEHTCLCALEPNQRKDYAAALSMVLKPVGHYLAVFYRVVGNPDEESPPYPVSAGAIDALFGEAFETVESFVPTMSYASRPFGAEEVRLLRKRSF